MGGRLKVQFGWTLFFPVALAVAAGCNSDTYPVAGTITFEDGAPVSEARVIFRSTFDDDYISAFATTDRNGQYSLTTWQTDDGAVAGEHVVIITKPRQLGEERDGQHELLPPEIHEKFASYETTPLKCSVKREVNVIDLTVERSSPLNSSQ